MRFLALTAAISLASCGSSNEREAYYLYRGSVVGSDRIYIAKFDAPEGRAYNEENCMIVRGLMERQPGVMVAYWCTQLKP